MPVAGQGTERRPDGGSRRGRRSAPRRGDHATPSTARRRSTIRPRSQRVVEGKGDRARARGARASRAVGPRAAASRAAVARTPFRVAAPGPKRARRASGARGRQIVAPMSISAWVQSAGPVADRPMRRQRPGASAAGRAPDRRAERPAEDPSDVRVDRPDRAHRRRSTRPPARCTARSPAGASRAATSRRHDAAVVGHDRPRRAAEVQRSPVVAHALPRPEDVGRAWQQRERRRSGTGRGTAPMPRRPARSASAGPSPRRRGSRTGRASPGTRARGHARRTTPGRRRAALGRDGRRASGGGDSRPSVPSRRCP